MNYYCLETVFDAKASEVEFGWLVCIWKYRPIRVWWWKYFCSILPYCQLLHKC